jgi:hypothetical protein
LQLQIHQDFQDLPLSRLSIVTVAIKTLQTDILNVTCGNHLSEPLLSSLKFGVVVEVVQEHVAACSVTLVVLVLMHISVFVLDMT